MWIKDLYLDAFDDHHALALQALRPGLNAIQVPGLTEQDRLRDAVAGFMFGRMSGEQPTLGSLLVHHAQMTWDICRVPGDDQGIVQRDHLLAVLDRRSTPQSDRERHVRLDDDQAAFRPAASWLRGVHRCSDRAHRALWTDQLEPKDRIGQWREAGWVRMFVGDSNQDHDVDDSTQRDAAARWDAWQLIHHRLAEWRRQLDVACQTPLTTSCDTDAAGRDDNGCSAPSAPGGVSARQAYLGARSRIAELQQGMNNLTQRLQEAEQVVIDLDSALRIRDMWQEANDLERKIASAPEITANGKDLQHVMRLDHELVELRRRLRRARGSSQQQQQSQNQPQSRPVIETLPRLGWTQRAEILADWPDCLQKLNQLESAPDRTARHFTAEALRQIRDATRALRAARSDQRAPSCSADPAARPPGIQASEDDVDPNKRRSLEDEPSAWELRRASLQRQIHQMRDESRRLLARQLLSRQALVGIGMLFSIGIAILMTALLLDLDGTEMATGAIGLTCLIAAALLKVSFERTPVERLRAHRMRVARLIQDLQRLPSLDCLTSEEVSATADAVAGVAASEEPSADDAVSQAESAWRELLNQLNLSGDLAAPEAMQAIRRRADPITNRIKRDARDQIDAWCGRARRWWMEFQPDGMNASSTIDGTATTAREWWAMLQQAILPESSSDRYGVDDQAADAVHVSTTDSAALPLLQRQLRQRKQERQRILQRSGAIDANALREQLRQKANQSQGRRQWESVKSQLDQRLLSCPRPNQVRDWLDRECELAEQRAVAHEHLAQLRQQIQQQSMELADQERHLEQLTQLPRAPGDVAVEGPAQSSGSMRDQVGQRARRQGLIADCLAAIVDSWKPTDFVSDEPGAETKDMSSGLARSSTAIDAIHSLDPPALRRATRYVRFVTGQARFQLRWHDERSMPELVDLQGTTRGWQDMSVSQQRVVTLCLQLALIDALGKRLGQLPIVLSGHSVSSLRMRISRGLVALLQRIACRSRDRQVICVSSQPRLIQLMREQNVPTLVVARRPFAEPIRLSASPTRFRTRPTHRKIAPAETFGTATETIDPATRGTVVDYCTIDWQPIQLGRGFIPARSGPGRLRVPDIGDSAVASYPRSLAQWPGRDTNFDRRG